MSVLRAPTAAALAALVLGTSPPAAAQDDLVPREGRAVVTVVPGSEYGAGRLHRFFFGTDYRSLWTTPITVPVLDLDSLEGGLRPLRRGGFGQTTSLHLLSADGRRFVFRSVNKDPSRGLPSMLRGTFVDAIVQDQISALHPDAAIIVAPLLEAAGVLHAEPHLLVMPDDPRLGEFRNEFAGMLATLEERPDEADEGEPGFAESRRVVGTERLFERMEDNPRNRVDGRDFLAARLMDLFLGDRDRHSDQWRWARFPEGENFAWRAIPRDRDQAFFALGGFVPWLTRFWTPQFVAFGDDYPNLVWATWNGRGLDRRILVGLERSAWQSVAADLQARLSDSVIDAAVERMPPAHYALNGERLARLLKLRRDKLGALAGDYYRLLAEYVDIHATDKDEVAFVTRLPNEEVEIRLYRRRKRRELSEEDRYFRRLFQGSETKEIRLFMHGGDDRVVVQGAVDRSILMHIVGGGGDDELLDSSLVRDQRRRTRFYDSRGDNEFFAGSKTVVDTFERTRDQLTERFEAPPPVGPFGVHARNWGSWLRPAVWVAAEPDVGLFLGGGMVLYTYGFRKTPYRYQLSLRGGYALGAGRGRAEVRLESPSLAYNLEGAIVARASGIDVVNFHGFGNETLELDDDFVRVRQELYTFTPTLTLKLMGEWGRRGDDDSDTDRRLPPSLSLQFGPVVKVARTRIDVGGILDQLRPLGINTFGQVGAVLGVEYDSRDRLLAPSRGLYVRAEGHVYAPVLTVEEVFGRSGGEVRTYLTPGDGFHAPTLALRVGAEKVWGTFPFFEAAFVGGSTTLRGFRNQRFAGDGAVYGGGELRLALARYSAVVPGQVGVFGFTDVGRVFFEGEDSNRWHVGAGGGIWLSILERANTVSIGLAKSAERVALYAGAGFAF